MTARIPRLMYVADINVNSLIMMFLTILGKFEVHQELVGKVYRLAVSTGESLNLGSLGSPNLRRALGG